ncbi:hypothetical protein RclHR1_00650032 [Rhizophagus clarus]|uniref:Uncharacterized protein n=1 Tax=Rhizophagus clarus TaxID=94130 RepID=A0A2Z6RYB1_9GLOM|nr:hypothetical protein RclHR1_00650032 [Rhizophagus clarus]
MGELYRISLDEQVSKHRRRSAESLDPWMEFQSIRVVNENSKVFTFESLWRFFILEPVSGSDWQIFNRF